MWGGQGAFLLSASSQLPSAQNNHYARIGILKQTRGAGSITNWRGRYKLSLGESEYTVKKIKLEPYFIEVAFKW